MVPQGYRNATFSATTLTQVLDAGTTGRWHHIHIDNNVGQVLLVTFGVTDADHLAVAATSGEVDLPVPGGFKEVRAKLAAAGSGEVIINVT